MRSLFLLPALFLCSNLIAQKGDSTKFKFRNFELSFGQSLLFISNSKQTNIINNEAIVIPTSAILFSTEFRPDKLIRIPIFLNIATESKQFLVNLDDRLERNAERFTLISTPLINRLAREQVGE